MTEHRELTKKELETVGRIIPGLANAPDETDIMIIKSHISRIHPETDSFEKVFYQHLGALLRQEISIVDLFA